MSLRLIYLVCAEGEEDNAELIAPQLRRAGYDVAHIGTTMVGDSLIGEAAKAVASGSPIVLCATAKAVGSAWAHKIVNSARAGSFSRVYVVQLERQAYVEQLALDSKIARYCDDPAQALDDLLEALSASFPVRQADITDGSTVAAGTQFLDQPTKVNAFDTDSLNRFRQDLRKEVLKEYPPSLNEWEFLRRAGLLVDGGLTRTGVLLFARNPSSACPNSMVKCTRYYGRDRAAVREAVTFEGTVQDQIVAARQFIAERVQRGEAPSRQQAQSVQVFDYPMVAVREVIANALVHRDYAATDSCAHVRLFDDRLEVCSPGIWVGRDLSPGREFLLSALAGESKKRNIRLAHVLSWIRLVEGEGSGILSAIRDCEDVECPIPIVTQDNGFISVILRSRESGGYRDNDKVSSISLQQVPDIDIAFLTELGGSPAVVEDRVNLVRAIVDRLRSSAGSAVVRAAVFGYRDHEALHRVHARDDDEKLVVGCGLDSVDMVRRELDRAELWCAVPIVSNRAAPVEDALRELSCTSSWRQGVRHVVVILGSRPPHPPVADPGGGLTTPCPHGYAWEDYMTALRERHSVDCLAVVESQLGMTGRDEDRFWARLGEDGMFTGGTSLDRLIEAVVSRPVAELEKSEECR